MVQAGRTVCEYAWLGQVEYPVAWALQKRLAEERARGIRPDMLLLLEHPPVYTTGKRDAAANLRTPERMLGAPLIPTDRGGDITFHGPGQLVAYPIIDLRAARLGIMDYVRRLEALVIATLGEYEIRVATIRGLTGVWVAPVEDLARCENGCLPSAPARAEKIAAIGVRASRPGSAGSGWITTHGLALNVSVDLRWFERIVPCGISDRGVTSMQKVLGTAPAVTDVAERLARHFGEVFGRRMVATRPSFAMNAVAGP